MMKRILITGTGSYVGEQVRAYISNCLRNIDINIVDTKSDDWEKADYSKFDVVFHVAGIAHVNAKPEMESLYYKVNRDLTLEVAKRAKAGGVRQFIFMSSQIVFHESRNLKSEKITEETRPTPNGFYGDSKLQAEKGLHQLEDSNFKVCILRPCMIYGIKSKGNFMRLASLARKTLVFPAWHNKRSMLYIDNLSEFVMQAIIRELSGTFHLQNKELADTVEIVRFFAKSGNHRIWISHLFNPLVKIGSWILQPLNKMFATYYYDPKMTTYNFDYQLVGFEESLKRIANSMD